LNNRQYSTIKSRYQFEVSDSIIITLTPSVISKSTVLLEKYVLRGMDSLPIAYALEWEAERFVSSDKRQIEAAKRSGLRTELITG